MSPDFQSFSPQGDWVSGLSAAAGERTLAHAVLIFGEEGLGKRTLASLLAAALLCREAGPRPCGRCASCRQVAAGEHPDLILLQPGVPIAPGEEAGRRTIPVGDIREMISRVSVHAYEGAGRVVLIRDADQMTAQAQNALLKTLEDPPAATWLILSCEKRDLLLPTIVSRCRPIRLHPWRDEVVLRVLREHGVPEDRAREATAAAGGSIGRALRTAGDEACWTLREDVLQSFFRLSARSEILKTSTRWKDRKAEAEVVFSTLEDTVSRLLSFRLHPTERERERLESSLSPGWVRFAEGCDLADFATLLDGLSDGRKRLEASVNFQAIVEQILLMMMEAYTKWSM